MSSFRSSGLVLMLTLGCLSAACKAPRLDAYDPAVGGAGPAAGRGLMPVDQEQVRLARVDGRDITLAEYQRRLEALSDEGRRRLASSASRQELLDDLILLHLLADRADEVGLSADPEVEQAEQAALARVVAARETASPSGPGEIPDEAVRAYYNRHIERYQRPERRRLGLILAADEQAAGRVIHAYENRWVHDMESSLALFEDLGTRISIAPLEALDLGFVERQDLAQVASPRVVEAAFELDNVGEISNPVPVVGGQAIWLLVQRRQPLSQSYEEVVEVTRDHLRREQRQRARDRWLVELRENAEAAGRIEVDDELLAALEEAAERQRPAPVEPAWRHLSSGELEDRLTPRHDIGFLTGLLAESPSWSPGGNGAPETRDDGQNDDDDH